MNPHLYEEKPLEIKAEAGPADIRHSWNLAAWWQVISPPPAQ
jgi:hypothetical protein